MRVKDVMQTAVVTVSEDLTIPVLLDTLQQAHVHGAPVVDDYGELVGFVAQEDILVGSLGRSDSDGEVTVADIMTSPAITVAPDSDLHDLARMMWRFRIHHVPVVSGSAVVGIVSSLDFCRLAAELEFAEPVAETKPGATPRRRRDDLPADA